MRPGPSLLVFVGVFAGCYAVPAMIDIEGALRAEAAGRTMKRDEPLPFAKGQKFSNLDSYLAHLQELGTRDIPFYERMSDGRYKLVTPFVRDPNIKRVFTRHELLDKYGFSH